MKNVFAVEHTKNQDDFKDYDGACFISGEVNDELQAKHSAVLEETKQSLDNLGVSLKKILPKYILFAIGFSLLAMLISSIFDTDVSLSESIRKNFALYSISIVCLGASAVLFIVHKVSAKKYENSEEFKDYLDYAEQIATDSMESLGIPEQADSVDVLSFIYKVKKDKTVSANKYDFMPLDMFIFTDEEYLHLSDTCVVFSFKKENVLQIQKVDKKATMAIWNKEEELRSPEYKPYKMSENNNRDIIIRNYYSLQLVGDGDEGVFEILFPPYEIDRVAAMLGITVTDRPY